MRVGEALNPGPDSPPPSLSPFPPSRVPARGKRPLEEAGSPAGTPAKRPSGHWPDTPEVWSRAPVPPFAPPLAGPSRPIDAFTHLEGLEVAQGWGDGEGTESEDEWRDSQEQGADPSLGVPLLRASETVLPLPRCSPEEFVVSPLATKKAGSDDTWRDSREHCEGSAGGSSPSNSHSSSDVSCFCPPSPPRPAVSPALDSSRAKEVKRGLPPRRKRVNLAPEPKKTRAGRSTRATPPRRPVPSGAGLHGMGGQLSYAWLEAFGGERDVLEHCLENPRRANTLVFIPEAAKVAFGAVLEPYLTAALGGELLAWLAVWLLPRLLLQPDDRSDLSKASDVSFGRCVLDRCRVALEGRWDVLVSFYLEERSLAPQRRPEDSVPPPGAACPRVAHRFCALAEVGMKARALQACTSSGVCPYSPEMEANLRAKIHRGTPEEEDDWSQAISENGNIFAAASENFPYDEFATFFRKAVASSAKRSSPGFGGWRLDHLRGLVYLDTCGPLLTKFFHKLATGQAPSQMYDILGVAKLTPLRKKASSDIEPRPVGATDPLWRVCFRTALLAETSALKSELLPHGQLAVGVSSGAEMLALSACKWLEETPGGVLISGDQANAFNTFFRGEALREAARICPKLACCFRFFYTNTRYAFFANGSVEFLPCGRGAFQGCPGAMAWFCLARAAGSRVASAMLSSLLSGAAKPPDLQSRLSFVGRDQWWEQARQVYLSEQDGGGLGRSIVFNNAFADDGLHGVPQGIAHLIPPLFSLCLAPLGLSFKPSAWQCTSPSPLPPPLALRLQNVGLRVRSPSEGLVACGAPVGDHRAAVVLSPTACAAPVGATAHADVVDATVARMVTAIDAILGVLPSAPQGKVAPSLVYKVLVGCILPRLSYVCRVCPPAVVCARGAPAFKALHRALRVVTGWTEGEFESRMYQVRAPPRLGGFGFIPLEIQAPAAFVAAVG